MMFYENLPEALLFFPSLATDRLLALLGVGEGGLCNSGLNHYFERLFQKTDLAVRKLEPDIEWTEDFIIFGSTCTMHN